MKTKLSIIVLCLAFVACTSNEFKIDSLQTVNLHQAATAAKVTAQKSPATTQYLSALDIVKQTTVLHYNYMNSFAERAFDKLQRDTVSAVPALKMWATDIINTAGVYQSEFIESTDVILVHWKTDRLGAKDTIAYIPNATLRDAETAIKEAYGKKDLEKCVELFNTAFTFRPTTGAEYRALKLQNMQ